MLVGCVVCDGVPDEERETRVSAKAVAALAASRDVRGFDLSCASAALMALDSWDWMEGLLLHAASARSV